MIDSQQLYAIVVVVPSTVVALGMLLAWVLLEFAHDRGQITTRPVGVAPLVCLPYVLGALSADAPTPDGGSGGGAMLTGASASANPERSPCSPWIGQHPPQWAVREVLELAA